MVTSNEERARAFGAAAAVLIALAWNVLDPAGPATAGPAPTPPQQARLVTEEDWTGTVRLDLVQNYEPDCRTTGSGFIEQKINGRVSRIYGSLGSGWFHQAGLYDNMDPEVVPPRFSWQATTTCPDYEETVKAVSWKQVGSATVSLGPFDGLDHVDEDGLLHFRWQLNLFFSLKLDKPLSEHFSSSAPEPEVSGTLPVGGDSIVRQISSYEVGAGITATITVNLHRVGCTEPRSARSAAATGADVESNCLKVTSPADKSIIAVTDGKYFTPQIPAGVENQRAPKQRKLLVEGIVECGCPVTVNGVSAEVDGTRWRAQVPGLQPGHRKIEVKAGGNRHIIYVDIVELRITAPREDQITAVTTEPAMPPDLKPEVELVGYPGAVPADIRVEWKLKTLGTWRARSGWMPYRRTVAEGSTPSLQQEWTPRYRELLGGWARLSASATIPGVLDGPTSSDPRWFDIRGTNAGKDEVLGYIARRTPVYAEIVQHIACHESLGHQFQQFNPRPDSVTAVHTHPGLAEPKSTDIPADWAPNPAPLRPMFGGRPAGNGLMQLDQDDTHGGVGQRKFPDVYWNWKSNVAEGIRIYEDKMKASKRARAAEQARLDAELTVAVAVANAMRPAFGLSPLKMTAQRIPDMTEGQHRIDAIRRYNGGREYFFNAHYVVNPLTAGVDLLGTGTWTTLPHTGPTASYVYEVATCPGLPKLSIPAPEPSGVTPSGAVPAGGGMTVDVGDFFPGEAVTVVLHSRARTLPTLHADGDGQVSAVVAIPADVVPGAHTLTLTGAESSRREVIPVTVTGDRGTVGMAGLPITGAPLSSLCAAAGVLLAAGLVMRRAGADRTGPRRR